MPFNVGRRAEDIIFSAVSFGQKVTFGVGGFIAGIGLDLIQFPTQSGLSTISSETVLLLGILADPGVFLLIVPTFLLYWHYRIGRAEHERIREKLVALGLATSSKLDRSSDLPAHPQARKS